MFRKVGSDLSDVVKGKCVHPRDGGDMVSKAWLVISHDPQIFWQTLCGESLKILS